MWLHFFKPHQDNEMTKRQMHNGENVHLPFFIVGIKKPKFFIYTRILQK